MLKHYQRLTLGIVLLVNVAAVIYSAYIVWLRASWLFNLMDRTLTIWSWIFMAVQLAGSGILQALLTGAVLFGINLLLLRLARNSSWRIPLVSTGVAIAIISGTAIISSVRFVINGAFV